VIACYDGDRAVGAEVWAALAGELGVAGLLVPAELGGAGASEREAAVVLEELGRFVAPVPFLTSSVMATTALLAGSSGTDTPGVHKLLGELAAGSASAVLAVPFSASTASFEATARVDHGTAGGCEHRLTGRLTSVAGALAADHLLVPVSTASGMALHLVAASSVRVEPVVSLDMSRQLADLSLDGAPSEPLLPDAGAAIRRALSVGAALLASEQVGLAQWCLETTVANLNDRRQFGRVVGGFQALKHRLADLYVRLESARAAARYAAATWAAGDPDREVATSLAQTYCSQLAVDAAEECVQLHGGIGMTWEYPAHLYLKRAKANQLALGSPGAHRRRLGELVNLPGAG
jgi:alkylation response protein AidB-like acyl-CoA dehydrogenase